MSPRAFITSELLRSDRPYLVVALTGGIGTGKSAAAARLAAAGATIIDADILARRVVVPGTPGFRSVVDRYGPAVVSADGTLDRRKLGELILRAETERTWLESVLHPLIRAEFEVDLRAAIERANSTPPSSPGRHLIVYVVPLLFESGLPLTDFDYVVVVAIDRATARQRIVARDNISPEEADRRLAAQLPIAEKVRRADIVIENTGTVTDLERAVDEVAGQLRTRPPRPRTPR